MPNDDLISRAEAIQSISDWNKDCDNESMNDAVTVIKTLIELLPAVDAVPVVHAQWIQADLDEDYVTCSYCKAHGSKDRIAWNPEFVKILKQCPECGARMGRRQNDAAD